MTHTPGPWYVEGESDNVGEAEVIVSGIPNGGGRIVAWTANSYEADTDNETTTDEDRANTRLIAAAPDLLGKLKALLEIMEDDHYKCDLHSDEDCDLTTEGGWHVKHHEMRLAKQAIDKATGQCIRIENLVADCQCKCDCHDGQSVASDYDPDCSSCCIEAELEAAREGVTA